MSLGPTYTITGSPITADDDPNVTAPSGARKFSPPTLSVGPAQLWFYAKDGSAVVCRLWFHDATNGVWVEMGSLGPAILTLANFPYEFGTTAELFLQVVYVSGSVTKIAYGFGIGSIAV